MKIQPSLFVDPAAGRCHKYYILEGLRPKWQHLQPRRSRDNHGERPSDGDVTRDGGRINWYLSQSIHRNQAPPWFQTAAASQPYARPADYWLDWLSGGIKWQAGHQGSTSISCIPSQELPRPCTDTCPSVSKAGPSNDHTRSRKTIKKIPQNEITARSPGCY